MEHIAWIVGLLGIKTAKDISKFTKLSQATSFCVHYKDKDNTSCNFFLRVSIYNNYCYAGTKITGLRQSGIFDKGLSLEYNNNLLL